MTSGTHLTMVREKAAYVRLARRRMNRARERKHDLDSDLINALAAGRLTDRATMDVLDARFDEAYSDVAALLNQLRKASPLEWRSRRGSIESGLQKMQRSVANLEAQLAERNNQLKEVFHDQ